MTPLHRTGFSTIKLPTQASGSMTMIGIVLAAFALWLLNHPYKGIWHDARIYALISLNWLDATPFSKDLFFSYGSQGEMTAFTAAYGGLIRFLGVDAAARFVVLSGAFVWIVSAALLTRATLGPGLASIFATFMAAVVSLNYSPQGATFTLNENFATARSWGAALGLAAIAVAYCKAPNARLAAWALGVAATAFHPLMGIWSLALLLTLPLPLRHVCTMAAFFLTITVLTGVLNIDYPLIRQMDGAWLENAIEKQPGLVFREWNTSNLPRFLLTLAAFYIAQHLGSPSLRDLYARCLVLGSVALLLALGSRHWLPMEILLQGQPWRAYWLLMPIAGIALLDVFQKSWKRNTCLHPIHVGVVVALIADTDHLFTICALLIALSIFPPLRSHLLAAVCRGHRWLWPSVIVLTIAVTPGIFEEWNIYGGAPLQTAWTGPLWILGLATGAQWELSLITALIFFYVANRFTITFLMALFPATALASAAWDQRTTSRTVLEHCFGNIQCEPHTFKHHITAGDVVYWHGQEERIWYILGTSSYYGQTQSIGVVFSEAKYYESERRRKLTSEKLNDEHLCIDPIVDWIILDKPLQHTPPKASTQGHHLYGCNDLRVITKTTD